MDYKLIAADIDGTLTNSRKEITPRTRYALLEAQAQGKRVILASGRHPAGVMPIAHELRMDYYNGFVMSFNGGRIIECSTGRTIVSKLFPREYLPDIVSVLKGSNVTYITFDDKRIYAGGRHNDYSDIEKDVLKIEMVTTEDFVSEIKFDINKIVLAGEPYELDEYLKLLSKRYDGLLEVYKSAPYFLELMPFGVSKGSMLPQLLEKLNVDRSELIAFGDHYNDMTMIGYAGLGVAMANGEPEIKKIANYVCESNDEDGIANTLQKFVLK